MLTLPRCRQLLVLLFFVLLQGCSSIELLPGAEHVQFVDVRKEPNNQPKFEFDLLNSVSVEDGSGCGLFGSTGSRHVVETKAKNAVSQLGGDTLLIELWQPPGVRGFCFDNTFSVAGAAVIRWWPEYSPAQLTKVQQDRLLPTNFEHAWTAMVDYVSSTFFKIRNYEKESGLLTLELGRNNLSQSVDCGLWKLRTIDGELRREALYVEEFEQYMNLEGQMNLRLKREGQQTRMFINTNYEFQMKHPAYRTAYWEFASNQQATADLIPIDPKQKEIPARTCQPIHNIESVILEGISALVKQSKR